MLRRLVPLVAVGAVLFAACSVGDIQFDLSSGAASSGAGGATTTAASSAGHPGVTSTTAASTGPGVTSTTAASTGPGVTSSSASSAGSGGATSSSSAASSAGTGASSTASSSAMASSSASTSSNASSSSSASSSSGGVACILPADCASGHCVGGVCCNTACTGACMACNLAPYWVGTCVQNYVGAQGNCPQGEACGSTGICHPESANGAQCNVNAMCASHQCTNGMCVAYGPPGAICTTGLECQDGLCNMNTHLCN